MDKMKKLNNAAGVLSGDLFVCGLVIKKEDLAKLFGVNDSKKLTEKKRAELFPKIVELAVDYAIIDGNKIPEGLTVDTDYLVKGDEKLACISAASILAKVTRDRLMIEQAKLYPNYGFEKHKGYLTKDHLEALQKYGPCEIHRLTYKPVKDSMK